MNIQPAHSTTPKSLKSLAPKAEAQEAAASPQEQVQLGQTPAQEALQVLHQMAQARVDFGHQLIAEVLEPSPAEFQEVSQATMPHRQEVAQFLSEQTGADTDPFYLLATETRTLAQASVNAENRADFQAAAGLSPNRESLLTEELGFLVEANLYQGMIPLEQLQQILPQEEPEGEKALSAGTFVQEVRKHVPAEVAQQVSETAALNPLLQVFGGSPELRSRFASALDQNFESALKMTAMCDNYFALLANVMQYEMQAGAILAQEQAAASQ